NRRASQGLMRAGGRRRPPLRPRVLVDGASTSHIPRSLGSRTPHRISGTGSKMEGHDLTADDWIVHKFGGTSVASADRYRHVARVLAARPERRQGVVVSAMSGVTDALIEAVERAGRRDAGYRDVLDQLHRRHRDAI